MAYLDDQAVAQKVLEFFNTVNDPHEIRHRIKDDPNFSSVPSSGLGIAPSVASSILATRNNLPGGEFTSLEQIASVSGVGFVTLHNILDSFQNNPSFAEDWKDIPLEAAWLYAGSDVGPPPQYYKDVNGRVYIRGAVKLQGIGPQFPWPPQIGHLPASYAPDHFHLQLVPVVPPARDVNYTILVHPSGLIELTGPANRGLEFVWLDGISFRAASG